MLLYYRFQTLLTILSPFVLAFPLSPSTEIDSVNSTDNKVLDDRSLVKRVLPTFQDERNSVTIPMVSTDRTLLEECIHTVRDIAQNWLDNPMPSTNILWQQFMGQHHEEVRDHLNNIAQRIVNMVPDQTYTAPNNDFRMVRVPFFPTNAEAIAGTFGNSIGFAEGFWNPDGRPRARFGAVAASVWSVGPRGDTDRINALMALLETAEGVVIHELSHLFSAGQNQGLRDRERAIFGPQNVRPPRNVVRARSGALRFQEQDSSPAGQIRANSYWRVARDVRYGDFYVRPTDNNTLNTNDMFLLGFTQNEGSDLGIGNQITGEEAETAIGYRRNVFVLAQLSRGSFAAAMNADSIAAIMMAWMVGWSNLNPQQPTPVPFNPAPGTTFETLFFGPNPLRNFQEYQEENNLDRQIAWGVAFNAILAMCATKSRKCP